MQRQCSWVRWWRSAFPDSCFKFWMMRWWINRRERSLEEWRSSGEWCSFGGTTASTTSTGYKSSLSRCALTYGGYRMNRWVISLPRQVRYRLTDPVRLFWIRLEARTDYDSGPPSAALHCLKWPYMDAGHWMAAEIKAWIWRKTHCQHYVTACSVRNTNMPPIGIFFLQVTFGTSPNAFVSQIYSFTPSRRSDSAQEYEESNGRAKNKNKHVVNASSVASHIRKSQSQWQILTRNNPAQSVSTEKQAEHRRAPTGWEMWSNSGFSIWHMQHNADIVSFLSENSPESLISLLVRIFNTLIKSAVLPTWW